MKCYTCWDLGICFQLVRHTSESALHCIVEVEIPELSTGCCLSSTLKHAHKVQKVCSETLYYNSICQLPGTYMN